MLASIGDPVSRDNLKANVLNRPAWEESILFACERLARGDPKQQEACGATILAAFEVDPGVVPVARVIADFSARAPVVDLTVREPEMEGIIREIYEAREVRA